MHKIPSCEAEPAAEIIQFRNQSNVYTKSIVKWNKENFKNSKRVKSKDETTFNVSQRQI